MPKLAIVVALEREVKPLVRNWCVTGREHEGRRFKFFENDRAVLVCGGIGTEAARRATEAIIVLYHPALVLSAGFAGALDPTLKVGEIFTPRRVLDATDGSSTDTGSGSGALVSFASIAGMEQKAKLARAYKAQAVDMEAASVARGAQARGVRFQAVKAILDESDFALPPLERFVSHNGEFRSGMLAVSAAVQPWQWPRVIRLARNSSRATQALCHWLGQYNFETETPENSEPGLRPIIRA